MGPDKISSREATRRTGTHVSTTTTTPPSIFPFMGRKAQRFVLGLLAAQPHTFAKSQTSLNVLVFITFPTSHFISYDQGALLPNVTAGTASNASSHPKTLWSPSPVAPTTLPSHFWIRHNIFFFLFSTSGSQRFSSFPHNIIAVKHRYVQHRNSIFPFTSTIRCKS